MNRRKFIQNSALLSTPLLFAGVPVFAGGGLSNPLMNALSRGTSSCDKILVIIQMNGGNDGLNMVIPLDRYDKLAVARPNLLIPSESVYSSTSTKVAALPGSITTGLHPAMSGLRNLFSDGKVAIVQGVSYPNPNYSHFQAQDIWFSASNVAGSSQNTGWLGRELDTAHTGFPTGYPNTSTPTNQDPLAVQIGGTLPLSLQGPSINMGYNVPNPTSLVNVALGTSSSAPANDYGTELTFLRNMKLQSNAYTTRIQTAYGLQNTIATYPTSNSLADQLKVVARLIGGGLATQVYVVNHSDTFDTHIDQVISSDHGTGYHANILGKLSGAIAAFQADITAMNKADRVTGMTFSEFGRRVIGNASLGSDHGSGAPVILFGAGVNGFLQNQFPGIHGGSPVLPAANLITTSTQVPTQFDFRQLYATVMQDWLCMDATQSQTILGGNFSKMALFRASVPLPITGIELSASWSGNLAGLDFTVNGNDACDRFVIERSRDAVDFSAVGSLSNYSNNELGQYHFEDERIGAPEVFYRVKAYMKQGDFYYSNIVKLTNGAQVQVLRVYPNPVTNYTINIEFIKPVTEHVEISITGMQGEQLYYNQVNPNGTKLTFRVSDAFVPHTLYVLRVSYGLNEIREKIAFA